VRTMPATLFLEEKEKGKERVQIVGQTEWLGIRDVDLEPVRIRHILICTVWIYPNG
jgi:hypothetical protein